MEKYIQVLDYSSTHPNATIWYHAGDMIIMTDIDTAYLVLSASLSIIAGHFYFTNHMLDYSKVTPAPNGPILA